jgi:glyoxylase-like metal-dependent hydrolase (beta-lactamase superfamily II)
LAGSRIDVAPEPSEIEVSLFGPGYGESIVLHLGANVWFIVDSCIDPATGEPAPLEYLRQIRIEPAIAVRQVIATHWHDDHIRGLGRIVASCEAAEFVCSAALRQPEFLTLVTAYGRRAMMASPYDLCLIAF